MANRKWLGPPKEPFVPAKPNSPIWMERHPTRYHWHPEVRDVVDKVFRKFDGISINTYVNHPEHPTLPSWGHFYGYNSAARSFDTWGIRGRGDPIDPKTGADVVDFLFNMPGEPNIHWIIWWGQIWTKEEGFWRPFPDDGTGLHFDHPHVTYYPKGFF